MNLLDSVFEKNEEFAWRVIGGSAFIVDSGENVMHELNEVGSCIWKLFDGKRTLKEIVSGVLKEFDASETQVKKDASDFVVELTKKDLVRKNEKRKK